MGSNMFDNLFANLFEAAADSLLSRNSGKTTRGNSSMATPVQSSDNAFAYAHGAGKASTPMWAWVKWGVGIVIRCMSVVFVLAGVGVSLQEQRPRQMPSG
jgi:hypothetical protein